MFEIYIAMALDCVQIPFIITQTVYILIGHSVTQQTACCQTFEVSALFGPLSGGFRKHLFMGVDTFGVSRSNSSGIDCGGVSSFLADFLHS